MITTRFVKKHWDNTSTYILAQARNNGMPYKKPGKQKIYYLITDIIKWFGLPSNITDELKQKIKTERKFLSGQNELIGKNDIIKLIGYAEKKNFDNFKSLMFTVLDRVRDEALINELDKMCNDDEMKLTLVEN